jgi:Uma2 family endonuclease
MTTKTFPPKLKEHLWKVNQPPPLNNGDHLTRVEFERRYAAQHHIKKAELIEGVVYMPSPVSIPHGKSHADFMTFLGVYRANTPGVHIADNATVRLDLENEVQPDGVMYIDSNKGGRSQIEENYLTGTPELMVEVAVSSASYDLHDKHRIYRRNGIQEYLILLAWEEETRWYQLVEGEYVLMEPDEEGIIKSQVFPGLYFHSEKFWVEDLAGLLKVLEGGLGSKEHEAFSAELAK